MNNINIFSRLIQFTLVILINIPIYFFLYQVFDTLVDKKKDKFPKIYKFSVMILIYLSVPLFYCLVISMGWAKILEIENFQKFKMEKPITLFFSIVIAICLVSIARISCFQKHTAFKDFLLIQVTTIIIAFIFLHMTGVLGSNDWHVVSDNIFKMQEGNTPVYASIAAFLGWGLTESFISIGRRYKLFNNIE